MIAVLIASLVGLGNDEAENLALLHVIKTYYSDVASGILRTASFYFIENFLCGACIEQRQFPQRPVVLFWVRLFAEFYCWDIALVENVLNLSANLGIAERWQVGEGFVTTLFR